MKGGHRRSPVLALAAPLPLALAGAACGRTSLSDPAITESVSSRLQSAPELGGQDIRVGTRDGVVTLTGSVARPPQRGEAEQIARESEGVKDVRNLIEAGLEPAPMQPQVGAGPGASPPADPRE